MARIVSSLPKSRFERYGVLPPSDLDVIYIEPTEQKFLAHIKGADFLWISSLDPIGAELIRASDRLKLIQTQGVGYDKIDLAAAAEKGIYVCNTRSSNRYCVAEHTLAMILSCLREIPFLDRECRKANSMEARTAFTRRRTRQLSDCHVGLVGFGDIGRTLASYLQPFGCRISYYSRTRYSKEIEEQYRAQYLPFEELLQQCNIISLHVPASPSTVNMINEKTLKQMRRDAILVNCSRGELVDSAALAQALKEGWIERCALDTVWPEYPGPDHPLLNLPSEVSDRMILTPHCGGFSDSSFTRMLSSGRDNILRVMSGERPLNIQNGI